MVIAFDHRSIPLTMSTYWFFQRHEKILIYIPNLIGYLRLVCSLYAFSVAQISPVRCVVAYSIGFICDDLDGRFARLLNQTSLLGQMLDMVTDRLSTAGLFVLLSMIYQDYFVLFLILLMLDIFSHWSQMYYVLITGKPTHKEVTSKSWLIRLYYGHRIFMGICCISCEVLYLSLYLLHWLESTPISLFSIDGLGSTPLVVWMAILSLPGFLTKQVVNVFQLKNAIKGLASHENNHLNDTTKSKIH